MRTISKEEVLRRMQTENVWWEKPHTTIPEYLQMRPRAYFDLFYPLVKETSVKRAVLLMGPRRVGKTVLIHHTIQELIKNGTYPKRIGYVSVDHPIYIGCSLEDLLARLGEASGFDYTTEQSYVFFDEIQYLKDWEVHLKSLVDSYPSVKFTVSGSAAAALRLKSNESGAGRFTDFLLPPLTFHEYLDLLGKTSLVAMKQDDEGGTVGHAIDIQALNESFLQYLNIGGYPEVVFSKSAQADPARFIKSDIIDKVLLRDLPSLYGIQDIQELNYLFTTLAFNTANEISLEELSQNSGVAKNTIKRYIEYLEAAFLLKVVHRIDRNSKRFQRANFFKVYLTNPSMRSALFSPVKENDEVMGHLAETGIFSQWFHSYDSRLYYARWNHGEVDIVSLGSNQKPFWAVEVKWSDRPVENTDELRNLINFCHANKLYNVSVTTRTVETFREIDGIDIEFIPASVYCYTVGYNIVRGKHALAGIKSDQR